MESNTFAGLANLHYLYLQNNQITTIESGLFAEVPYLQMLSVDNNLLTTLPESIAELTGLTE